MASITKIGLGANPQNSTPCIGSSDGGTLYCPSASSGVFTQAQKMQLIRMSRAAIPKMTSASSKGKGEPKLSPQAVGVF